ncbi:autotransporter assembly complex protein TamA [Alkanindiges illinoisensis]|uniref:autotransporter assembly complex protein TamA n=1 Tax=Alkanindiges illinoisensis TaxID=197183 RepID=UPI0009FECF4F|nr:autotransporter assembly complex family protein [Alkanindiges illinoisensis]
MQQSPNTQLKTLVKALRLALYPAGCGGNGFRRYWHISAGLVLLGSSAWAGAEPGIPAVPVTGSDALVTTPLPASNDLPLNDNVELAPVDITALMQEAQQAKQTAASDAGRITAPSTSANVPEEVIQSTNNELIVSSITNGLGGDNAPAQPARDVDPINEMASAEAELEQAREATQISADNADLTQGKKPDQVITENAAAIENPEKGTEEAREQKKPNIFKRIWYRFWPPKGDLGESLPTITARVEGAPRILANNIEAKLEQYTVEAFSDFRASLPQLRSMAREASEAVGYYKAEFRFEQVNSETVRVLVTPNEPVMVQSQDIRFEGEANEDRTFQEIREKSDLKVGDQMNDELYEKTKGRIATAGTEKGYFDGYWVMHDVKVTLPENTADINLDYNSGERYKLGAVEFKNANPDEPIPLKEEVLRKLVPFDENDDYGSWKVNTLSRNLSDTRYFNNVQVDVVTPDPIIKPIELPADADVNQLTTMQRQSLAINNESGEQQTAENTENAPAVDESQFAGVAEGDTPLERSAEAQQKLSEAEQREADRKQAQAEVRESKVIPVVVTVNADKPNSAEVGVGYGTDTEFRLRSQYRKALVNSRGHSLESNLELSKIRQAIDVRYNLPYKHPLEDTISIFGGYEKEERKDVGRDLGLVINTATVGVERAIKPKNGDWQHTISARYRLDQLERNKDNINQADLPPPFNLQSSRFEQEALLFGYGLSKTYTVGRLDPTRAFRQFYQVEVGSKKLLTDADMAILRGGWRFIYSFGENDNHQFVGRADASTIVTDNFEDVPYNLRFFAGGDQSIRGYDYKSLSTEKNGYLIGGQNLAVGSLEYNYQFIPKWRGAVFVDAGNAFDKDFNDPVKVGAGIGVRWSSPVGPIRVDVGAGVSEKEIPIRLHFFIGPQL